MPKLCKHCGKMHATQEELEGGLVDPAVPIITGDGEPEKILPAPEGIRGNEELSSSEPLPHEFPPEEAPETLEEKYVPKRSVNPKKMKKWDLVTKDK